MCLNGLCLSITIWSTYSYVYNYEIIKTLYIIGAFNLIELLFVEKNKDIIFHHMCVLCVSKYVYNQSEISNGLSIIIHTGLASEISTLFLVTKDIIKPYNYTIYHSINDILFVLSFLYFRVYNFGYVLLNEPHVQSVLTNGTINDMIKINIGVYGLFLLNLYWTRIILIKICKISCKKIENHYFNKNNY